VIYKGFGDWGTPGSGGWVGVVILVLRTFPELVVEVCTNLGGDWSSGSGMKRDIGSLFNIYRSDYAKNLRM